ncbi:MAG: VIT1/CCC1 transporter family protein [Pseudomonadota bacterium]|nr:VIT1/CCC1 transporter family protein [Pseudomonadota bacterium]
MTTTDKRPMDDRERWQDEAQSAWLYGALARAEPDPRLRALFVALQGASEAQSALIAADVRAAGGDVPAFAPSLRVRLVASLARTFGPRRLRAVLPALKIRGLSAWSPLPPPTGHTLPTRVEDVGRRHGGGGKGGALRAAVFGVNDGLVSNTSLLLGVAGASASPDTVLLSGLAGLLAGAFSMAAGEWVSVASQRELFERQIAEERDELERYPAAEAEELALIYIARGLPPEEAHRVASMLVRDPERALDTLAREELGLDPDELGSPWRAAISSFVAFALGATLPLIPLVLGAGDAAVPLAAGLAAVALFTVGAVLSLFSGRSAWSGGLRMLGIGAAAGAATWGAGKVFGVVTG